MASEATDTLDTKQLLHVLFAFKKGDFSQRMPVDQTGTAGKIADTLNDLIEQSQRITTEFERVGAAVGKEGRMTQRASVGTASGAWATHVEAFNALLSDVVQPFSETTRVIGAVARGDLSQTMTLEVEGRPLKGEYLKAAKAMNGMVEQLSTFAQEVIRVAREVGTEGKLGGQADVKDVAGTWKDLTDNVNAMAGNLTAQVRNIAEVTTAVANGDLSRKITVDVRGEILQLKDTINTMVDQLRTFSLEVTRIAREVGTEGRLGGQAVVQGVAGTWKDLTDSVNAMAQNLTAQVRNIADVTTAVARGDLNRKITVDVRGEILDLKNTVNTMVDQLNGFASEVTRIAREVGTEGKLGGQAEIAGVGGTWKDLTDSVNAMAQNLTAQVRNIADVTTAVARGDLGKKVTVDAKGELLELKETINTMVDQLNAFASEVTRVAREVGTEGRLGGQAVVRGAGGTWRDLTDSVNGMAGNLTAQVRNIAEVTTAVASGDLSKKITVDVQGEILDLKKTINTMVDQLSAFAGEVTRVAREVGTEGKLGGQALVPGVAGTWKDLTDNVNRMASNLTTQVRNIAEVATAIAGGDLSKKITVNAQGEILDLKKTINTMVDQLRAFASEVTRVAREVGTEGKLGGQASVKGVAGTWKDLTDNVNGMASNLTGQVRNIAEVATAIANGDLSRKITVDVRGEILQLKDTINTMVDQLNAFASEVTRVAREVGTEGRLGGQATVRGVAGTWKDLTDSVNGMASNLTGQVRNIAEVSTAIANGDLSRKITVDVRGEILQLKNTINTMVDQLNAFASEVTRVAREVGTEGKLGGQASVKGVAGTWKGLTDNVNFMAANLTTQVRSIAQVVTAVANGDLKKKLVLQAAGEIGELADTINAMNDTLGTFGAEVTRVAREVGIEGRLGGQAAVPGTAGLWRDLTDNVNQLAANLTGQVRAIAEVSTAVAQGNLTRSITVEAAGEVAALKDNINQMIRTLRETTDRNAEQDWLKTNIAKLTRTLQGQRDLTALARSLLSEAASLVGAQHGAFYLAETDAAAKADGVSFRLLAGYAYRERKGLANRFKLGEGLVGQCALEKERILLTEVPQDYVQISSGLGAAAPQSIVVLPVLFEREPKAILELATLNQFTETQLAFLEQLAEGLGIVLNTIAATMRTEELLQQSQSLTEELQTQQEELQAANKELENNQTRLKNQQEELQAANEELEERSQLLTQQKRQVEDKNREVERARALLQDKAGQLSLTSKYKSEFLANMSHELRTPLNSMLILSKMLSDNPDGNLTAKQCEYAKTVNSSGADLLALINDILDLSKIEAGSMAIDIGELRFAAVREFCEQTFRPVAEQKRINFGIEITGDLPPSLWTDGRRLHQVLKNLLSNAFKFTEKGGVLLTVRAATDGWSDDQEVLDRAEKVVAFAVRDTGIGISRDKHRIIFEAFQQADGTTSRKYGGTGLGLSISREIAKMLGGALYLESEPGKGSTFTLYLPITYTPPPRRLKEDAADEGPTGSSLGEPSPRVEPPSGGEALRSRPADTSAQVVQAIVEWEETEVADDREAIQPGDRVLLVVEDDTAFAQIVLDMARARGFKGLVAGRAETALRLVKRFSVDAITLDLRLPDRDGWTVLDRLKHDARTRHIPVHIISVEEGEQRGLMLGAIAYLHKPASKEAVEEALDHIKSFVERPVKKLLVVEDDEVHRQSIAELIGNHDVQTIGAATGEAALSALRAEPFDCMVLDLGLPDMTGFELIERLKKDAGHKELPIIVYTGKELSKREETELRRVAEAIVIKGVTSPERLLDETALFLHRVVANLPEAKRRVLERFRGADDILTGRKVLIVDDDVRNIFALTSLLDRYGILSVYAENGKDGIALLERTSDIDAVLMDVMMPEMDGYETMRAIREIGRFKKLPIIALTAKAMKGDREKCIEAGASEYVAKPVDTDQLLSLLRVWLYR
ncbi:MAG: HAMP domain-containing protein [Deltaproteobacteria bacterium]|nr:HAMP domain-containing protein [Deltaproteobacteria bacterium]